MTTEQASKLRRQRPPPRIAEVVRVSQLTPYMVRVTLGAENMEGFFSKGPAEHACIYLPNETTGVLTLPVEGPEGLDFPTDVDRLKSRAYTPRRSNAGANQLDVDFVIRGEGPASAWAASVKAGDPAVVSGQPSGAYLPETDVDWYSILGDEAALPAIASLVEVLPASMRVHAVIEVLDANEGRSTPAMREATLPEGDGRVWVSAEASIMRDLRRNLLADRGLERSRIRTQGYWKDGSLNHTDHDMGDDV
jgi:NADPH-dependent ferric siderophore reductase